MIERKQKTLKDLTAMARSAMQIAARGTRAFDLATEKAERIETDIDRLALASGFTVDEVYAPIFAVENARWPVVA